MTSAPSILTGHQLIIFNDYNAEKSPPATITNTLDPPAIVLEYSPKQNPEADTLREELVQFKATCASKPAVEFLNAIEDLIGQNEKLEVQNTQLKALALKHAEALYADMAMQLLAQIRRSPGLEKELNAVLAQKEHIGLQELVSKLNEAIEDDWVEIDPKAENHTIISIEQSELRQLGDQINLLAEIGKETNRQQTVLLKSKEFQQQIHPKQTSWGKKVVTGVLYSGWVTGQVSSFALRMCLGLTPSIIALLPSIFPAVWLELLKLLMTVLYKKMPKHGIIPTVIKTLT